MAKRLKRPQKMDQAVIDILNKMFEIAGHDVTYDDIKDRQDKWFQEWKMTMSQNDEWKEWGKKYLKRKFGWKDQFCEIQMGFISMNWGLSFSDWPE